jgi:ribosomal protein S18 acetylase RimI-like enzyme
MVTFRTAKPEDAAVLTSLMHQSFGEIQPPSSALQESAAYVRQRLETGEQAVMASMGDEVVAMVRFSLQEEELHFFRLCVHPAHRRKGLARQLLQWLQGHAASLGKKAMVCGVRKEIDQNVRLYAEMGFVVTREEILVRSADCRYPVVYMRKELINI